MEYTTIGNRIRTIREARGITQEKLAALTGISIKHISVIERGVKEPRLSTVLKIAEALQATPNDLLLDLEKNEQILNSIQDKLSALSGEKQEKVIKILDTIIEQLS